MAQKKIQTDFHSSVNRRTFRLFEYEIGNSPIVREVMHGLFNNLFHKHALNCELIDNQRGA